MLLPCHRSGRLLVARSRVAGRGLDYNSFRLTGNGAPKETTPTESQYLPLEEYDDR
jgi:hypothetical protein